MSCSRDNSKNGTVAPGALPASAVEMVVRSFSTVCVLRSASSRTPLSSGPRCPHPCCVWYSSCRSLVPACGHDGIHETSDLDRSRKGFIFDTQITDRLPLFVSGRVSRPCLNSGFLGIPTYLCVLHPAEIFMRLQSPTIIWSSSAVLRGSG